MLMVVASAPPTCSSFTVWVTSSMDSTAGPNQPHISFGLAQGQPCNRFGPFGALLQNLVEFIIIDATHALLNRLQEFDADIGQLLLQSRVAFPREMIFDFRLILVGEQVINRQQ